MKENCPLNYCKPETEAKTRLQENESNGKLNLNSSGIGRLHFLSGYIASGYCFRCNQFVSRYIC